MLWLWIILAIIVAIVGYFALVELFAIIEVRATKREDMFMCDKHGAFPKNLALEFAGTKYCPHCFDAKWKDSKSSFESTIGNIDWKQYVDLKDKVI